MARRRGASTPWLLLLLAPFWIATYVWARQLFWVIHGMLEIIKILIWWFENMPASGHVFKKVFIIRMSAAAEVANRSFHQYEKISLQLNFNSWHEIDTVLYEILQFSQFKFHEASTSSRNFWNTLRTCCVAQPSMVQSNFHKELDLRSNFVWIIQTIQVWQRTNFRNVFFV